MASSAKNLGRGGLHPGNPASKMSSIEMGKLRDQGVNVDKWTNPGYTGGIAPTGPGTGGSGGALGGLLDIPESAVLPSGMSDLQSFLQSIADKNNAWSASQAQKQMDFQRDSADRAMQFNHDEAELSRKWQEYMSNTAHQREIKDLKAAGLNPVLSAQAGAPVTSGATASGYASQGAMGETDHSVAGSLVSLLGSMLSAQTQLASTALSARSQEAIASKYTEMDKLVAQIQQQTQYGVAAIQRGTTLDAANISALSNQIVAKIHAGATVSAAQLSAEAAKVSASIHAAAQKYGYDLSSMTQRQVAAWNNELQKELKDRGFKYELQLQDNSYNNELLLRLNAPQSNAGIVSAGVKSLASLLSDALGGNSDLALGLK